MQTSHKSPEGKSPLREKVPRGKKSPEDVPRQERSRETDENRRKRCQISLYTLKKIMQTSHGENVPRGKKSPEGKSPQGEKVPRGRPPARAKADETDEKEPNKFVHTKENNANFPRGKCPPREKVP